MPGIDDILPFIPLSIAVLIDNPLNEAGAFSLTSDALAPDRFPRFAGKASSSYVGAAGINPLGPVEGRRYAGALHADSSYQRLAMIAVIPLLETVA